MKKFSYFLFSLTILPLIKLFPLSFYFECKKKPGHTVNILLEILSDKNPFSSFTSSAFHIIMGHHSANISFMQQESSFPNFQFPFPSELSQAVLLVLIFLQCIQMVQVISKAVYVFSIYFQLCLIPSTAVKPILILPVYSSKSRCFLSRPLKFFKLLPTSKDTSTFLGICHSSTPLLGTKIYNTFIQTCNNLLNTQQLKPTQIYHLAFLQVRSVTWLSLA